MTKSSISTGALFHCIAMLLVICWSFGFFVYDAGSMIHILLAFAIVVTILEPLSKMILIWLLYNYFYENQQKLREKTLRQRSSEERGNSLANTARY